MAIETTDGTKLMACFCLKCNEIFHIPSRRGRPPHYCSKCLGSDDGVPTPEEKSVERREQEARERVDRLEWMLRLRGQHISQHRDKWE